MGLHEELCKGAPTRGTVELCVSGCSCTRREGEESTGLLNFFRVAFTEREEEFLGVCY